MSDQASTYFNQAQMMLLDLHSSILRHLMATESMEEARKDNQDTVELFDGVVQRDGIRDVCSEGLDRVSVLDPLDAARGTGVQHHERR